MKTFFLFLKPGLPVKPDCTGEPNKFRIFFSGFFTKIKFSTSLYKKNIKFYYGHMNDRNINISLQSRKFQMQG